jgi:hypothetical protein
VAAFKALQRTVAKQCGQLGAEMTIIQRGVEATFGNRPTSNGARGGRGNRGAVCPPAPSEDI